ncbi:hypothetical protein AURDEDRAFT_186649 [Auricularia subglabra TFB-10046 SS5]|nr:hypothetical protein AURDEDRAFT_186649 [Auricularia subglabra TFB-10046 SS5]
MTVPQACEGVAHGNACLNLIPDEVDWLKRQTGIYDTATLERHIVSTQRHVILQYFLPQFEFCRLRMSRHPVYHDVLTLGRERPGAILLELGCCFGNDVRKAAADGFPASRILASDSHEDFWTLGCDLFRDLPGTVEASFVARDLFADSAFTARGLKAKKPRYSFHPALGGEDSIARCVATQSLEPIVGQAAAIHLSGFGDISEDIMLLRSVYALLSSEPGSLLFGEMEFEDRDARAALNRWREMWKIIAGSDVKADCRVQSDVDEVDESFDGWDVMARPTNLLTWSVRRL